MTRDQAPGTKVEEPVSLEQIINLLNSIHKVAEILTNTTDLSSSKGVYLKEKFASPNLMPEDRQKIYAALQKSYEKLNSFTFELRSGRVEA